MLWSAITPYQNTRLHSVTPDTWQLNNGTSTMHYIITGMKVMLCICITPNSVDTALWLVVMVRR